jgi:hypothetical protein
MQTGKKTKVEFLFCKTTQAEAKKHKKFPFLFTFDQ